jgi:peptide/nickel transport system substrate-binding protein
MTLKTTRDGRPLGIVLGLMLAAVFVLPAFAGKAENSLRTATQQTIANIDPYYNQNTAGLMIADAVWDTLIYRDPETGAYTGDLATAWRWIDDKTLELDLRKGVRLHNGAAFDADDVVQTLSFVLKPENKAVPVAFIRWIDRVEKVDPYKVRIISKQTISGSTGLSLVRANRHSPARLLPQSGP